MTRKKTLTQYFQKVVLQCTVIVTFPSVFVLKNPTESVILWALFH